MNNIDTTVANTILDQMGGGRRIAAMTGARFCALLNGVRIEFPQPQRSLPNCVRIVLEADDTYTVTFFRVIRKTGLAKTLEVLNGMFCDMLKELFEEKTRLFLSL